MFKSEFISLMFYALKNQIPLRALSGYSSSAYEDMHVDTKINSWTDGIKAP